MWQRIQTLYLFLIVALMTAMLFLPLAVIQSGGQFYVWNATGLNTMAADAELVYPARGVFALTAIMALMALVTIFLFKTRIRQIRFCIFNAILMLGFYGLFFFFVYMLKKQYPDAGLSVKMALAFPLVSLILDYLAIRNIGADETLVRSLERLR